MLILYCIPPGFIGFIMCMCFLEESPRFLMTNNKYDEAFELIDKIFKINRHKENCLTLLTDN